MVNIKEAANTAIAAYAAAVQLGGNSSIPLPDVASAMAQLYLPGFTAFTLGQITTFPNETFAASSISQFLQQVYNASGLGTDIKLEDSRVECVSDQAAFAFITWKIFPKNEFEPYDFVDVYGFRAVANRTNGLPGGWESSIADNEYEELLKRIPGIFGKRKRGLWGMSTI